MKPKMCVPIVEKTREKIIHEAKKLVELPIQLVEWRMDYYEELTEPQVVISLCQELKTQLQGIPLLVTFRSEWEGGTILTGLTEQQKNDLYNRINHEVIQSGSIDMVDVEAERVREGAIELITLAQEKGIKVIGSHHDFEKTPSEQEMLACLNDMRKLDIEYVKLAVMPKSHEDVERLLNVTSTFHTENPSQRLITISMAAWGEKTRILGGLYGSEITYVCQPGRTSAPGQVTIETMQTELTRWYGAKRHVILVGFMGTGKTTIAWELEQSLGLPVYDTDEMIEAEQGRKISDIFAKQGEEAFREMETELLTTLADMPPGIISCGGGMVLRQENRKKLQSFGQVILLTATPETICERVNANQDRPLLEGRKQPEQIAAMLAGRKDAYTRAADTIVSTDDKSTQDIAEEILNDVNNYVIL